MSSSRGEIENLKKQLETIRTNYLNLLSSENEGFNKAAHLINQESDKRLRLSAENREKEIAAANKAYESQVACIDSDFEKEFSEVQKQVTKIIQFRLDSLGKEFPEMREEILKYDTPLKEHIAASISSKSEEKPVLSFEESNSPILTKKEISSDMQKISSNEKFYQIANGTLTHGRQQFKVGSNCSVQIGDFGPFSGSIEEIKPSSLSFIFDGGNTIEIPLQSLNMGLISFV